MKKNRFLAWLLFCGIMSLICSIQKKDSENNLLTTTIPTILTADEHSTEKPNKEYFSIDDIPQYEGDIAIEINNNITYFTSDQLTTKVFEEYSVLDSFGRCGVACANICKELMPTEERGAIGMIKPSGWHNEKYAGIDGNYIYNRCHLIAYMLAGENANERNLITGTRYFNTQGMLPYEAKVADYIYDNPDHHVLYRITPIFLNDELVARGVLMEAKSVEDHELEFCVFVYNVQPGCEIDYKTGYTSGPAYEE